MMVKFQSTRPMRGATLRQQAGRHLQLISIHAPHAGRDGLIYSNMGIGYISIHAPHAGRDEGDCNTLA